MKEDPTNKTIITPEHPGSGPRTEEEQARMEELRQPAINPEDENAQRRKEVEGRLEEIEKAHRGYIDKKERETLEEELAELESDNIRLKERHSEEKMESPVEDTEDAGEEEKDELPERVPTEQGQAEGDSMQSQEETEPSSSEQVEDGEQKSSYGRGS